MKAFVIALLLASSVISTLGQSDKPELTIVTSPDASAALSIKRLKSCLNRLAHESNLELRDLPHIVVFQVSKIAARGAYITKDVVVRRNTSGTKEEGYYEVWLVGDPKLNYILAFENVLEDHFQLKLTDDKRAEVMKRVTMIEDATVEVAQGK